MSVDILGASWDQCRSMAVQYSFMSTEKWRLVRTDSPGRPPRLSHSSWTIECVIAILFLTSTVAWSNAYSEIGPEVRCDLSRRLARKITKLIHSTKSASLNRPVITVCLVIVVERYTFFCCCFLSGVIVMGVLQDWVESGVLLQGQFLSWAYYEGGVFVLGVLQGRSATSQIKNKMKK